MTTCCCRIRNYHRSRRRKAIISDKGVIVRGRWHSMEVRKWKMVLIKDNMTRDDDTLGYEITTPVTAMVRRRTKINTCRRQEAANDGCVGAVPRI